MGLDGNGNLLEKYSSPLPGLEGGGIESVLQGPQLPAAESVVPAQPVAESMLFAPQENKTLKKKDLFFIAWAKGAVKLGKKAGNKIGQIVAQEVDGTKAAAVSAAERLKEPIVEITEEAKETVETWKQYIKTFGLPATIIVLLVGGFIYWRVREGDINPNLKGDVEEWWNNIWNKLTGQEENPIYNHYTRDETKFSSVYTEKGLNDLDIQIDLRQASVIDRDLFKILSAESGGMGWILPLTTEGEKPDNAPFLAQELAKNLLNFKSPQEVATHSSDIQSLTTEILNSYESLHNDPTGFLNWLQSHGANQTVVNFGRC